MTPLTLALALTPCADLPPLKLPDPTRWGRHVQRSMRLMAERTKDRRNTVRVLFYGQSITEQRWSGLVADDLRRRFPHADLVIENRALGGFASQVLVKTAETDLYPFAPDLLIFHVYGAHDKYEDILRRVRERTCAEVLQQTDHVTRSADLTEETDPAKLPPKGSHWDAFMNHNWLPALSRKYGTELCDVRSLWKGYLRDNRLEPKRLLRDAVHLNADGERLMAGCVGAYLRHDPKLGPSTAEGWVTTLMVGKDVNWRDGALRLEFDGNRVDAILGPGDAPAAAVRIDGRKPSEFPELYGFTRALAKPGGKWPVVADLSWEKTQLLEEWTMEVTHADGKRFDFTLRGSRTGADGGGRSDRRFVSDSGRVAIDPDDWNVAYALALAGVKPVPERFTVRWNVVPHFVDELPSPAAGTAVTLAQGLTNGRHTLELRGTDRTPVRALRVYRPPLGRK